MWQASGIYTHCHALPTQIDTSIEKTYSQSYIDRRIYRLLSFVIVLTTTIRLLLSYPHWCNRREDQTAVKIIIEFLSVLSIQSQNSQNRHCRYHESVSLLPFDIFSNIVSTKISDICQFHIQNQSSRHYHYYLVAITTITVLSFLPSILVSPKRHQHHDKAPPAKNKWAIPETLKI
jgi:hypothetical protein